MSEHLRTKLADFIDTKLKASGKSIPGPGNLDDSTPLITSGILESLHLLELALLLEEEIGSPLDLTAIDFVNEWDTIGSIIIFINSRK
jgi:acyl carrier protein